MHLTIVCCTLAPRYGVAMISRLLQIIGLFCKRALYKRLCSANETYHFKEPTHRSHPIFIQIVTDILYGFVEGVCCTRDCRRE